MHSINEVQIYFIKPVDGLVGFASFVLDNCLYIGSIGIYTRPQGGYRLTYPTKKGLYGNIPLVHPINKNIADLVELEIFKKLENVMKSYVGHNQVFIR
jgi:DNA-binding cell septation regulator SpoVG